MQLIIKGNNILQMKNVTEDDINAFYSRQGAHAHTYTHQQFFIVKGNW